jgi:ABC-type transporter Mla MlaB component
MAKEDKDTATGLLSKVVKFVRNPATNWSDLDGKEAGRDEVLSKQLLKEMIERKRRNDFVRKREFDMLRKMRKREAMNGQDPGARPSFFQSSMPSKPDDRAVTLKKIDEIEAQMSMQWWKTKHGNSALGEVDSSTPPQSTVSGLGATPLLDNALPTGKARPASYDMTVPSPLTAALARVRAGSPGAAPVPASVQSQPVAAAAPADPAMPVAPAKPPAAAGLSAAAMSAVGSPSGFSSSKFSVVDGAQVAHDPDLEEAAIRFANGDDEGAEAGLLEMLERKGTGTELTASWLTLFDLYRATGQSEKFENQAIEFVGRFERSAPQWFSLPDMVASMAGPANAASAQGGDKADWVCPSTVGIQTVAAMSAAMGRATMPWRLDWHKLNSIDANAVEPLCKVFDAWSTEPVKLGFMGESRLRQVLLDATPSGVRETDQAWWQLLLASLRVTHRPDEFELAALDFCVTYELSPPAWASAKCDYKPLTSHGETVANSLIVGDVSRDAGASSFMPDGDTQVGNSAVGNLHTVELAGEIQGDAVEILDMLEAKMAGADIMVISCAKLIRVDFSAAGTLLNWVSEREAEGRDVQFTEVNRVVAAFFHVIGITEHARVFSRID